MRRRALAVATAILSTAILSTAILSAAAPAAATPGPQNAPEYWFDSWHVPQLWQSGADGHGVVIAEVDTGVNAGLPELKGRILPGIDYGGGGNGQVDRQINSFGHGTAMASIMVARPGLLGIEGLAPAAKIIPVAVPLTGTADAAGNDHLADAIRWSADHGAKVISMSLGGTRLPDRDTIPCPEDEQQAIYYALAKGDVLLAASGNGGAGSSAVEEPGVCLGVVSVGAVDATGTVASFSSRHPYLTMSAPGVNIPSLGREAGTAYSGDGTSQATALASAAVALVWSKYPHLTGQQVVTRVLATLDAHTTDAHTTDAHTTRQNPAYGYGILDAYRAVTESVPADATNPVFTAVAPFLLRFRAFARASAAPAPNPVDTAHPSVGVFRVGASPRLLAPPVLDGLFLAAAGLLALVALAAWALIGRHRRRAPVTVEAAPDRPSDSYSWQQIE
jgi:subtilisin family serine protease